MLSYYLLVSACRDIQTYPFLPGASWILPVAHLKAWAARWCNNATVGHPWKWFGLLGATWTMRFIPLNYMAVVSSREWDSLCRGLLWAERRSAVDVACCCTSPMPHPAVGKRAWAKQWLCCPWSWGRHRTSQREHWLAEPSFHPHWRKPTRNWSIVLW